MLLKQVLVPFLIVLSGFTCLEIGIPVAVGEFVAGFLGETLFGLSSMPWLEFLSHLGVLSLMFIAGFEIDTPLLKKNLNKSLVIGGSSFFVPFILIFFLCRLLGLGESSAALVGIALSTTSLAIIFPSLREKGLLATSSGQLLLASAMVVDIISMFMLAVLIYEITVAKIIYAILVILGIAFVKRIIYPVFDRYKGNRSEFELKFLLLVLLSIGFLAEEAGIHAALFCFVLGILFSGIDPKHEEIMNKLSSVVFSLLAPAFFFHAGTMIQFNTLTWAAGGLFILFLTVAVVGKFFGTYLPLRFFNADYAKLASYLFNYRLSFGLISAIYGREKGLISDQYFNITLLTILFASILVALFEKKHAVQHGNLATSPPEL